MSNTTQSWRKYLDKHRKFGEAGAFRMLNDAGASDAGVWRNFARHQHGGLWYGAWSDVVQIASQVLKEDQ